MKSEPHIKKIQTIKVRREFEEEVLVKRKIKRDVQVSLEEIIESDIISLKDVDTLKAISTGFMRLYHQYRDVSLEQSQVIQEGLAAIEPHPTPMAPTETVEPVKVDTGSDIDEERKTSPLRGTTNEKMIGKKEPNSSSKYHYVSRSGHKYVSIYSKDIFPSELKAALNADSYLDRTNDDKRPRNRDEFDEVMTAYTAVGASNETDKYRS